MTCNAAFSALIFFLIAYLLQVFDRIVDGYTFEIKDLAPAEYGGVFYVFPWWPG